MTSLSKRVKTVAITIAALLAYGLNVYAQSEVAAKARAQIAEGVKAVEANCGADVATPSEGRVF